MDAVRSKERVGDVRLMGVVFVRENRRPPKEFPGSVVDVGTKKFPKSPIDGGI